MPYAECKVYNDGSHYVAIPYVPNPRPRRRKPPEEVIVVREETSVEEEIQKQGQSQPETQNMGDSPHNMPDLTADKGNDLAEEVPADKEVNSVATVRHMTRKELFEELYEQTQYVEEDKRRQIILSKMMPYFPEENDAELYVDAQFSRKRRNFICRKLRLTRKINLAVFNYFVTFTYSDEKHTEETFRKKLRTCLRHLTERKGWAFAAVWERSPDNHRLHFHGLFSVPEGTMPGEFVKVTDYNTTTHKMQTINMNTYFAERFGRNDFSVIESEKDIGDAVEYMVKYMEKYNEKIICSKNLPQFFISDIMDDDVVCTTGSEGRKLVLFDDFGCWDEGTYMGKVSHEVIDQMRKAN